MGFEMVGFQLDSNWEITISSLGFEMVGLKLDSN
jgi:hypothetical protein